MKTCLQLTRFILPSFAFNFKEVFFSHEALTFIDNRFPYLAEMASNYPLWAKFAKRNAKDTGI